MVRSLASPHADLLALEANAAGAAWACVYSSSAEYDAALIAEKRAAGVYGPKRHRRTLMTWTAVALALALIVFLVV